jgi:hypothetical protein
MTRSSSGVKALYFMAVSLDCRLESGAAGSPLVAAVGVCKTYQATRMTAGSAATHPNRRTVENVAFVRMIPSRFTNCRAGSLVPEGDTTLDLKIRSIEAEFA